MNVQTQIELQGSEGTFPGVPVTALSGDSRVIVTELLADILANYRPEDVAHARECLAENGGIEALHLSYYKEGEVDGSGEYQIFRLEGPAAVFYFRGFPHVHAFINVAMNGNEPLSVGEIVGENPAVLEGGQVKQLFEAAMQAQTGADFSYYEAGSVVGRLRKGLIRTGDIYNLESWQEVVTVSEVKGSRIRGPLIEQLHRLGTDPQPGRSYTVATTAAGYGASQPIIRLRDATIAYLRKEWARKPAALPA